LSGYLDKLACLSQYRDKILWKQLEKRALVENRYCETFERKRTHKERKVHQINKPSPGLKNKHRGG